VCNLEGREVREELKSQESEGVGAVAVKGKGQGLKGERRSGEGEESVREEELTALVVLLHHFLIQHVRTMKEGLVLLGPRRDIH